MTRGRCSPSDSPSSRRSPASSPSAWRCATTDGGVRRSGRRADPGRAVRVRHRPGSSTTSPPPASSPSTTAARWSTTSACAAPISSRPTFPPAGPPTLDLSELEPGTLQAVLRHPRPRRVRHDDRRSRSATDSRRCVRRGPMRPATDHAGHTMTKAEGAAMDQAMMESIAAFPAETEGLGNQPLEPTVLPDGTKRFELTAGDHRLGGPPGQDRPGVGVQRHGARPTHRPRGRRQGRGRDHQRAADRHRHPLARHRRAQRPGRRGADHPGPRRHRRDVHVPVHRRRAGDRHVPRPRPRPRGRAQRHVRHDLRRRRCRCRPGRRCRASRSRPTSRSPRTCRWCSTTPA